MSFYVNDCQDELLEFSLREEAWEYAKQNAPAYVFHAPTGHTQILELMKYNRWYVGSDGGVKAYDGEIKWNE